MLVLFESLGFAIVELFLSSASAVLKRQFSSTVVDVFSLDHIKPVHTMSQSYLVHPDILFLHI